ncbi:2-octaprenyl-3-methyl-6-methoxy-1,4-benzoquinol hydroxylase [uncultured Candidatus Thioglobus sp.]|nr:2-octaprenyl-3-methyl-6-methoxy-1,4-benzoquinol hydroxylase [uncultured Candidatus Thioglobus sp.]
MKQFDVVIVGGGMVGQALALSLSKQSCSIAIIEPNNPNPSLAEDFHTRVSAITPKSEKLLKDIGAWEKLKRKQAFVATEVWDQNSHGNLGFSATDEGLDYLGHIIENDAIQSALYKSLQVTEVKFISAKVNDLTKLDQGYEIELDDQSSINCKLLVGADGARSKVREIVGITTTDNDYQQKAIVCNIESNKDFESTTWQRFLSDSIIALLPLGEHKASIVWSAENCLADELLQLSQSEFAKRLSAGVEYRFGEFSVVSPIQAFPLIERSSTEYVQNNLVLVGDAAHNIHPLAGQGVNLGFSDVIELSGQLLSNSKPLGDYSVLRQYARARRLDNELMAKTMTGLNWIYKENNEPLRWLRGFGMNLINETPVLKSFLQKHALGNL